MVEAPNNTSSKLAGIVAVGYKINTERLVQFRKLLSIRQHRQLRFDFQSQWRT
jgi:hypothetical protein